MCFFLAGLSGWGITFVLVLVALFAFSRIPTSAVATAPILPLILAINLATVAALPDLVYFRSLPWIQVLGISIRTALASRATLFPLVLFQLLALGGVVCVRRSGWFDGTWFDTTKMHSEFT